jgi:hypothetical protein
VPPTNRETHTDYVYALTRVNRCGSASAETEYKRTPRSWPVMLTRARACGSSTNGHAKRLRSKRRRKDLTLVLHRPVEAARDERTKALVLRTSLRNQFQTSADHQEAAAFVTCDTGNGSRLQHQQRTCRSVNSAGHGCHPLSALHRITVRLFGPSSALIEPAQTGPIVLRRMLMPQYLLHKPTPKPAESSAT